MVKASGWGIDAERKEDRMRGNPLFAVVIPAKAGIQELPAKAGTSLDPGSSPGGFPDPSGKNS
jgi:hypothetical protein